MFVIQYIIDKNLLLGGLGDRIVGLISVKLISKLLKKNFYILWNKENIKKYINYKKYDYELLSNIKDDDIKNYDYIDNQKGLKKYLMTSTILFPNKINMFRLNQEITQYLYKNQLFHKENYIEDILNEYKKLYTDILIPTDYLMNKVYELITNKKNIVGVQVRCGDYYMKTNIGENYKSNYDKKINTKLLNIKDMCEKMFNYNYNIFFTTDNIQILDKVYNIFEKSQIIYVNDLIQHLDRKPINSDISKIFIDNYILSQKTTLLFISVNSNYGRIAALSSNHNNIYNFLYSFNISSI